MKFNLNKNKYSGGAQYLRYISAIFAFIQCCYAETVINTKEEFQHFVYETGWRTNAEYCANHEKDKWYNDEVYKDSIYKVIPQAIADCMQKKAEFKNVGEIVTFEANNPEKYDAANWNAVVLWNYLYCVIYKNVAISNAGVTEVGEQLKTYYGEKYLGFIKKAVSDIQTYAKDLNLYSYIKEIKANTDDNKHYQIKQEFDPLTKSAALYLKVSDNTIYINDGKEEQTVPTSVNEIHALPNFARIYNENWVDISANKCWFNSVMLNLYNSKTMHKVINELQAKSHDTTMPSYRIKQIFNDIRTGDMSNYGEHLMGLIKVTNELRAKAPKDSDEERQLTILSRQLNEHIPHSPDDCFLYITTLLGQEAPQKKDNIEKCLRTGIEEIFGCSRGCEEVFKNTDSILKAEGKNLSDVMDKWQETTFEPGYQICGTCGQKAIGYSRTRVTLSALVMFDLLEQNYPGEKVTKGTGTECPDELYLKEAMLGQTINKMEMNNGKTNK